MTAENKSVETAQTTAPMTPSEQILEQSSKYIKEIDVEGTRIIKPDYIMRQLNVQAGDVYSRDLIQEQLRHVYKTGFFSDRMKAVPEENADGSITLKIMLEENLPVTDFTIEGNTVVSTEEILSYLMPLKGKPQNITQINEAIENIQSCYSAKGYILARIDELNDDPDGTLNFHINEGSIDKILISGNEKTKDYVVERNILTEPGTVYNENLIKEDLVRLYATQAYKDVNREIEPSEENPEKYNVTIQVTEQRTASLSVGGGLDSATGVFGSVGIADNNFRGLNQKVGLNVLAGSGIILNDSSIKRHMNLQAELSFFEPYFINADNSLMSKIFFRDFGSWQIPLAIEQRFGAEATIAHKVKSNPNLSATFSMGVERINLREGDEGGIRAKYNQYGLPYELRQAQLEGGTFLTLSPGLVYDTRDTLMNPRHGLIATARFDEAIGLDNLKKTNGKLTGMIKQYLPVGKKSSFAVTARAGGFIHYSEEDTPEVLAYRLGGPYTIRGFKMSGVGTGSAFAMGSAEFATPIPFADKFSKLKFLDNVRLTAWADAGKIFNPTITDVIYDRPMQAITAGVGLKLYIPGIGPLSVDYGIPLTNPGASGNKNGYFTFGIGDMMY